MVTPMLQFAICDDEPHMVRELSGHLAAYMGEPPLAPYRASRMAGPCWRAAAALT